MPRIVSVWLRDWPIRRFLRSRGTLGDAPADPRPLVLATPGPGPRLAAVDAAAAGLGLAVGEALADARARAGQPLRVEPVDPAADDAALGRLCLWATRYAPVVAPFGEAEGADGFFLDVAGAAHLLGGEAALLDDLAARLAAFGLPAQVALADTPGLAWALARYGEAGRSRVEGGSPRSSKARTSPALDPRTLPVAALRLAPETRAALHRLGLRRVGQLMDAARAPLARRFGEGLLLRLDQALGRRPEPLVPVRDPPVYAATRRLLDPITRQAAVVAHARRLMGELAPQLAVADVGARRLRLGLYRVDGRVTALDFGLAAPTRDPDHLARLVRLRLDRPGKGVEAGFGFETLRLEAVAVGPLEPGRATFTGPRPADLAARLADALAQRLGRRVVRLRPAASHLPERSVARVPLGAAAEGPGPARGPEPDALWEPPAAAPRPLVLLPRAEPVEDVLAAVPDGPPQRFRWRGRLHRVAHAQGPERVAPEWWRLPATGAVRDYYVVEDAAARRLWLYREGLYGEGTPRWFVHGLFA